MTSYAERRLQRYDSLRGVHRAWVVPVYVLCGGILFTGLVLGAWDNGLSYSIFLMIVGWIAGYCSLGIVAFVAGLPPKSE